MGELLYMLCCGIHLYLLCFCFGFLCIEKLGCIVVIECNGIVMACFYAFALRNDKDDAMPYRI